MIDLRFEIPDFGWMVRFHCAVTCYHSDKILAELKDLGCPTPILRKAYNLMSSCQKNTGLTYSDKKRRESVVVVSLTTSAAEFLNSLEHEIRHLVDDIMIINRYYEKEDLAYLTGNINRELYPYLHHLLCDGCRKRKES